MSEGTTRSIEDVKAANAALGHYFFDRDSMRFFDSRILPKTFPAGPDSVYFVTSERFDYSSPRRYTVRQSMPNGEIATVGDFQAYATPNAARAAIAQLVKAQS